MRAYFVAWFDYYGSVLVNCSKHIVRSFITKKKKKKICSNDFQPHYFLPHKTIRLEWNNLIDSKMIIQFVKLFQLLDQVQTSMWNALKPRKYRIKHRQFFV